MRRLGLRTRVTAGFAAGALMLSATMALLSYELTSRSLLAERERATIRAAYLEASIVRAGLAAEEPAISSVLHSLDTGTNRRALLNVSGRWYGGRNTDLRFRDPAASLLRMVEEGHSGVQRVRTETGAVLVVGVPLSEGAAFYEVDSLHELENTLQVLALVLMIVAVITTGAGAALGRYASRHLLRPLASVADAAQEIAGGDLTARLDPASAPELERLTTSFNRMVDQLARRLERDRRFAADVSHELRSPLQTLAAAASVLNRQRDGLDRRTAAAARLVADEVARFESLVTDLLELARGEQAPDRTAVNMADLARQVCRSRGIPTDIVEVNPRTDVIWCIDRRRFERVLGNLIDNAIRHGGGPVAIRLGHRAGVHYLEVDDEGPGISPEEREVVFDRFVRGRSAGARGDSEGTGLGLALVAQHVAAHAGRAVITDRPGGGARFRVELPENVA